MKTTKHEVYVSLEVAQLLEEAGFDWKEYLKPLSIYDGGGSVWKIPLHIAQKWLREMKGLFICVIPEIKDYHATWNFYICNEQGFLYENEDCFLTYEDAQESGIKKALEIILENEQ